MSQLSEPCGVYQTQDDFIVLNAARPGSLPVACRALGIPNLEEDDRFSTDVKKKLNKYELRAEIQKVLLGRTTAEWLARLEAEDVWCGPVYDYERVFSDPQVVHNQMVCTVEGKNGPLRMLGIPAKLSKTPGSVRRGAPILGEHTEEILQWLGYAPEEIDSLEEDRVVTLQHGVHQNSDR